MINLDDRILTKVDESELWLLVHVAKRMNETGAFPTNGTLCKDTGWALNTLQKHKKSVIDKKILIIEKRFKEQGGQTSNNYKIATKYIRKFTKEEAENTPTQSLITHLIDTQKLSRRHTQKLCSPPTHFLGRGATQKMGNVIEVLTSLSINQSNPNTFSIEKGALDFSQSEIKDLENQLNAKKEPKEERLREVEVITPIEEVASDPPKQKPVKAARKKRESAPDLLFRESDYFLLPNGRELFENELVKRNEKFASFDINYYFEAALNWSDSKDGTMKNWVAAVANWIERDAAKGTAKKNGKIIPLAQTQKKAGQLTEYQNQVENGEYVIVEGRKISRATYQAVMARHAPTVGSQ